MSDEFKLKTSPKPEKQAPPKDAKPAKPKGKAEPKVMLRNQQVLHHHLFKAQVATCKKNMAFRKGELNIQNLEHAHFFHTIDSNGRTQTRTNASCGHFHYIEWGTDDDGNLIATCGPAIKEYTLLKGGRTYKKEKALSWPGVDQGGNEITVTDEHTHDMVYIGSDEIRPRARSAPPADGMEAQRDKLAQAGVTLS